MKPASRKFGLCLAVLLILPSALADTPFDLGDLTIPRDRIPDWTHAGVEGGIPDTSDWPVISVLDYGAIPDDDIEDTSAINNAIYAASLLDKAVVLLPEGEYKIIQPNYILLDYSNVVLKGEGPDKTIINSGVADPANENNDADDGIRMRGSNRYETLALQSFENIDGKTVLTFNEDLENFYPGYKLENYALVNFDGGNNYDCDGDGEKDNSWGCHGNRVDDVSGNTLTLSRVVLLKMVDQTIPDQTCSEIGGRICPVGKFCLGTMSITNDTDECCNAGNHCLTTSADIYPSHNIIGGLERGSNDLTVTQPPFFNVGDYIMVSQDNDDRISPAAWHADGIGQIVKVTGIEGTTVTIDPPLRVYFNESFYSRITQPRFVENTGVEDLTIKFGNITDPGFDFAYEGETFDIDYAINSWIKNIKAENTYNIFLAMDYSAKLTIRDSHFATVQKPDATNSYTISFSAKMSDSLATNNIIENTQAPVLFSHSASGNVYSYGYHKDLRYEFNGIHPHGTFPFENLIEGNIDQRITVADCYWGKQGPRNTFFRNRADAMVTARDGTPCVDEEIVADYTNVLLNTADYYVSVPWCGFPEGCFPFDSYHNEMWAEKNRFLEMLAWYNSSLNPTTTYVAEEGVCTQNQNLCAGIVGPTVKYCGWNCLADTGYDGRAPPDAWSELVFPTSLYLSEKPDFWCEETPWPAIGADVDDFDAGVHMLPAERRYLGLPCTPVGAGGCSDNSDCDDANLCTGDKCESGSCRYINYNLDGSDTVGLGDIIAIISHWGQNEGESGWNPDVDLNENGNVGLSDIIVLLGVWGAYC